MKRSTLYAIAGVLAVAALFFVMTTARAKTRCRVCVEFRGRTNCATAAGATEPAPPGLPLPQGVWRPGQIYVMERVPPHDGPETVLELRNRPEGFFAFRPAEDGEILLVSKVQTVSLSVDRQAPIADPARLSAARMLGLEVVLAGGAPPGGWARRQLAGQHARPLP